MSSCTNDEELFSAINEMASERVPFNKVLGLKVEVISYDCVKVLLEMRDELIGNFKRGILHGGVISSIMDVAGGLSAFIGAQEEMRGETLEARLERFGRLRAIGLNVDFLSPGLGEWFVATAHTLRKGNRVSVTRIELNNDQNDLIAVATASYVVG